jgi:hemerythrin-like domain-containing protein
MLREHDLGRALLAAMDESIEEASKGDAKAVGHYVENAKGYIAMLREHIHKEDHCLFPAADRSMSEAEGKQLLDAFTKVDKEEIGEIAHKRFIETANALAKQFDVPLVEEKESCCCA